LSTIARLPPIRPSRKASPPYRVALMLNLIGVDWEPVFVDFFVGGETRTAKYRTEINEMGEVPVLAHGERKLSQSAVCLTYLAERSGKFLPAGDDERLECLRWIIFDNQKVNGFLGPYRFLKNFAPAPNPAWRRRPISSAIHDR
jgi:glutathione S-transferase